MMAHFYGNLKGSRGEATRVGTKGSGISGHIRGWDIGACVSVTYDEATGKDVVSIRLTGGSHAACKGKCLGSFTTDDLKERQEVQG